MTSPSNEVLIWNINSAASPAKFSQLLRVSLTLSPSVICLCETKVVPGTAMRDLPSYTCYSKPFESKSGGLAAYVHCSIPCAVLEPDLCALLAAPLPAIL